MADRSAQRRAWVAAGLGELTGRPDRPPLLPPDGVVDRIVDLGRDAGVDALPLLAERVAARGLVRRGDVSAGGATRLLRAVDGWVAATLSRPGDVELLPAWLGVDEEASVAGEVAARPAAAVVEQGTLLGLPVARVGEVDAPAGPVVRSTALGASRPRHRRPVIVNLASLWAGPLCARLVGARIDATVVKVVSPRRPEPETAADEVVELDLHSATDRDRLVGLLRGAAVVIEGSRPRALEQAGIVAAEVAGEAGLVWVSITGYGRDGDGRNRVAFGDDAAAAGGLVAWDDEGPCFVADAVADPLAGVAAAAAALDALEHGGGCLLDVAMSRVAAHVAAAPGRWEPAE